VLLHVAAKAFAPGRVPFPVLHVDTGHNFEALIEFRDRAVAHYGVQLQVASVPDAIESGLVVDETGPRASRNRLQTAVLLDQLQRERNDVAFGGGRRDEEKARAKERILSFRDAFGQWDPKAQRPEPWDVLNARIRPGEHLRAFPLSNWTELDIWEYIAREQIELPWLYFSHEREVFERDGMLLASEAPVERLPGEVDHLATVRYRTIGDMTCTAAVPSSAGTLEEIIAEVAGARVSERGASRADDTSAKRIRRPCEVVPASTSCTRSLAAATRSSQVTTWSYVASVLSVPGSKPNTAAGDGSACCDRTSTSAMTSRPSTTKPVRSRNMAITSAWRADDGRGR
jgi:sulfate adenylyltransferase subunit 2